MSDTFEPTAVSEDDSAAAQTPSPAPQSSPSAPAKPRATPAALAGRGPRPKPVATVAPVAPAAPADDPEVVAASAFGRADDEGNVLVTDGDVERSVGQMPDVAAAEAVAFYARRYLELLAKVALFETRLQSADLSIKEIDSTLTKLSEEIAEPAVVGDLAVVRERLETVTTAAQPIRARLEAERVAAREAAVAQRTQIVERAEQIAATDSERMQWRPAGEEFRELLDQWKEVQRSGPRLDRPTEDSLWKRFSAARTTFDRERRHHFAQLEERNTQVSALKEAIVVEAEKLATSTDFSAGAAGYRDLMARWKAAGRTTKSVEDALWVRFRAAQDGFFAARDAQMAELDAEYSANLEVKLRILQEAEAMLPVKDLAAAKSALRQFQSRWEAAGRVPRADISRVDGRMRAVEQAVRDAEDNQWRRSNPETRARAEGMAAQLVSGIERLEKDLAKAQAEGQTDRAKALDEALQSRRALLAQIENTVRSN